MAHLSRRGVFFLSVAMLVAGCSGDVARPVSESTEQIRVAFAGANLTGSDFGVGQFASIFSVEGLTHAGIDGRLTPRLAESWTWQKNGLRLVVNLRSGVKFHDGTLLTSAVVTDVLRAAMKRRDVVALYSSLGDITAIRTDGPSRVIIDLSRPSAFLPEHLSLNIEHGAQNVGTGPYRLIKRDRSEIVFERFDSYYLGKPSIARVVITPFDTLRPAWASLLRGTVDVVSEIPPDTVEFIRTEKVQIAAFERGYQYLVAFNSQRRPFTSPSVRKALNLAIDRDVLISRLLQGFATPATGPLWPQHWAYDSSIRPYAFDPRTAAALLDAAGYHERAAAPTPSRGPARLRFTCLIAGGLGIIERIALELQKQLYEVGVDMQFEVLPPLELVARMRSGNFDAVLTDMISGPTLGRPYIFWRSAKSSRGFNTFGYEDPEAERLFETLRTSMNEAAVRSATQRLQQVLLDDPPALFIAWEQRIRAISRAFNPDARLERDPLLTLWQWRVGAPQLATSTSPQR